MEENNKAGNMLLGNKSLQSKEKILKGYAEKKTRKNGVNTRQDGGEL